MKNGCRCTGTLLERFKNWVVTKYKYHNSAFNGYRRTYSDKSQIKCTGCGAYWRTAAKYVEQLKKL